MPDLITVKTLGIIMRLNLRSGNLFAFALVLLTRLAFSLGLLLLGNSSFPDRQHWIALSWDVCLSSF
ncbi:hypothetical protein Hanom_Chr12g01150001 [Helianthus anomalus]